MLFLKNAITKDVSYIVVKKDEKRTAKTEKCSGGNVLKGKSKVVLDKWKILFLKKMWKIYEKKKRR